MNGNLCVNTTTAKATVRFHLLSERLLIYSTFQRVFSQLLALHFSNPSCVARSRTCLTLGAKSCRNKLSDKLITPFHFASML